MQVLSELADEEVSLTIFQVEVNVALVRPRLHFEWLRRRELDAGQLVSVGEGVM